MKKTILILLTSSFCLAQITDRNELLATSLWIFQKSFFSAGRNLNSSLAWSLQRNDIETACQGIFQIYGNSMALDSGFNGVLKYFEMDILLYTEEKIKKILPVQKAYESYMNKSEQMGTACATKTATLEMANVFYEESTKSLMELRLATEELARDLSKTK